MCIAGQVRPFREVLSQQSVRVFVGAAPPGTLRIAEVHFYICGHCEALVLSQHSKGWEFLPRAELRRKPAGKSNPFAGVPVLIIRQLGRRRPTGTERKIAQQKVRMEGWRQRRLGSEPKTHLRKTKTVLTSTGLLMEGVGPHLSRSGRRASCLEPVNHLVPSLNLRKAPFY